MPSDKTQQVKLAYSINEACEATSIGRTRMYQLINSGEVQATRIGKRTLIIASSLHELLSPPNDLRVNANDPPV